MIKSRTLFFLSSALLLLLSVLSGLTTDAQTATNQAALRKSSQDLQSRHTALQKILNERASRNGWPLTIRSKKGRMAYLRGIDKRGFPIYVTTTDNIISAATIRTSSLWPGGSTALSLNGSSANMKGKIAVWDEGLVRSTHIELTGRVTQVDNSPTLSDHSTHVSGTMIASGVNPVAKGMSNGAQQLLAYDFDNDESEMAAAAGTRGILVSSHSYAIIAGWNENETLNRWEWYGDPGDTVDIKFGLYDEDTQIWDSIAYNAPQYLIFKAGGNNRGETGPAVGETYWRPNDNGTFVNAGPRPANLSSNAGFNTISTYGDAKNVLTLGAVNPIPGGYSSPSDVVVADFSSLGPSGDGRIKPDLVADGVNVLSSISTADNAYDVYSGTSMATPAAAGSSFLLQEYYSRLHNGKFMQASTLKGLLIHTADEAGSTPGPDYVYGWGLINMQKAAAVITADTASLKTDQIIEGQLTGGTAPQTYTITASGKSPVVATLCWTDVPAIPVDIPDNSHNFADTSRKLVNDLDLRITDNTTGNTYYPWMLDYKHPTSAATKGDNIRDNVEKVEVGDSLIPGRTYTVTVSHKGTITRGTQTWSLLIGGGGSSAYCTSASDAASTGTAIDKVTLNSFSNTDPTPCTRHYLDGTSGTAVPLAVGQTVPLTLTYHSCGAATTTNVAVYLDINNNGIFESNELVLLQNGLASSTTPATLSGNITVPPAARTGTYTRMRIIAEDNANPITPDPCGTYASGETQDYRVLFTHPSNDVGVTALEDPTVTACANDSQIVAIHIHNFDTVTHINIPVTTIITKGGTIVATFSATCKDSIPAGGEVIFTYNSSFPMTAGSTYTFASRTALAADGNTANDSNSTTVTVNAAAPAINGSATICGANATSVVLKANTTGIDLPLWYDSQTATVPIAAGNNTSTNEITSNKTYYVAANDLKPKAGATSRLALPTTGSPGFYYPMAGQSIAFTTSIPLTIESAKLYVGHPGQITFTLGAVANDSQYLFVSSTTIDVYATKLVPATGRVNLSAGDNSDTGAIFYLNIPIPAPGQYILIANCSDSTNLFVASNITKNLYPFTIPGVISVTGNSNQDPTNPRDSSWQQYYFPLFDMGIRLSGCPGPRTAVTATTAAGPTISFTGNLLTSSAPTGNQWYLNDSLMTDSTAQSIQPTIPGSYSTTVTDPNTGCVATSNKIAYTSGIGGNASIGLKVGPNPTATGSFNLQFFMSTPENMSIQLYNTLGQPVYEADYPNFSGFFSQTINVGRLAAGMYVLKIIHGGSTYHTQIAVSNHY